MKKATVGARATRSGHVVNVPASAPMASLHTQEYEPLIDSTWNLIRRGHLIPLREFQALMGWTSPQSVARALAAHRIFAMDVEGQPYLPAFFADAIYRRRHLAAVTKQLGDLPSGAKLQFFGSRNGSLGGQTPLEALAAGRLEIVLRLAAAYAES